jgi:heavy metal sensor kinase
MFAKSIRLRFQLWLAFLLVAVLSGFGVTAFTLYRNSELSRIDSQLERRVGALSSDVRGRGPGGPGGRRGFGPPPIFLGPPPSEADFRRLMDSDRGPGGGGFKGPLEFPKDGEFRGPPMGPFGAGAGPGGREVRLSSRTQMLFDEAETNNFYFAIWSPFGTSLKQSTNAPANLTRPPKPGRDTAVRVETRDGFREAAQFTEIGDCILVGHPIADFHEANRRFALVLFLAGGAVLFVGLGGGWVLTTRALRPIRDISAAATQISAGDLSRRIDAEDTDSELGQLANLLNTTFGRLEAAFAQQKQFTADAAHELRTPLAVIISETQTTLARPRGAEEYRETIEACLETAQRMRGLTHSLLELARFDAGQEPIQREPFDLAAKARECVELLQPLARQRNVQLVAELSPAMVNGDEQRIGQVITNLISNAIHYNKDGGEARVTVRADEAGAVLTVADTGAGISEEALPHVFERFYRADKSRTRAQGGSGLGLAIAKAIVDAHQGSITVASTVGEGSVFTMRL